MYFKKHKIKLFLYFTGKLKTNLNFYCKKIDFFNDCLDNMYEIEYGYTSNPGYYDILVGIVKNLKWVAYSNASRFWQFTPPIWQFYSKFDMNQGEIFSILNFAILITILRYSFENFMYKVISQQNFVI